MASEHVGGKAPNVPSARDARVFFFYFCSRTVAGVRGRGGRARVRVAERLVRRDRERTKGLVVSGFGPMVG